MKFKDVLVFKNRNHVDWIKTRDKISSAVMQDNPTSQPSELAMWSAEALEDLKKLMHRSGVSKVYDAFMRKYGKVETSSDK